MLRVKHWVEMSFKCYGNLPGDIFGHRPCTSLLERGDWDCTLGIAACLCIVTAIGVLKLKDGIALPSYCICLPLNMQTNIHASWRVSIVCMMQSSDHMHNR